MYWHHAQQTVWSIFLIPVWTMKMMLYRIGKHDEWRNRNRLRLLIVLVILDFWSLNSGTSCGRLQWLNSSISKTENLSVLTHTEDVQIWDVAEAALRCSFTREEIRDSLKRRQTETCYAIRSFQLKKDAEPLILAGSSTPNRFNYEFVFCFVFLCAYHKLSGFLLRISKHSSR